MIDLEVIQNIFSPMNLLIMNVGLAIGIIIGALPGMTVILAVTVLLPFTFGMDSVTGMYLLLGAMCGGIYGGSITSILINTPGSPNNVATAIDGYELTKKGRAGDALKAALLASTVGGLLSCAALLFTAPLVADLALEIGPAEYFSLCVFGLCTVVGISGGSVVKSSIMAMLGVLLSTVGIDTVTGVSRFMFGRSELLSGLNMTAVMLGAFAVSEILMKVMSRTKDNAKADVGFAKATMSSWQIMKRWPLMVKNAILGVIIGAVPGAGAGIAAYLGYNISKSTAKNSDEYGTGCIDGVLAPEAANNGASAATLIPLLTLGIPGGPVAAVMLGALTMQGITPGPMLFTDSFWINSIMIGLFVINIFMLIQGNFFVKLFANFTKIPAVVLIPGIMIFTILGSFAIRNNMFDVGIMLGVGLVAFLLRRNGYAVPSMSIGLALGVLCETNLRRAMTISEGDPSIFVTRPISLVILLLSVVALASPLIRKFFENKKANKNTKEEAGATA